MRIEGVYYAGAAGYGYYTLNFKRSARDYTDDGQVTIADQLAREKGLDPCRHAHIARRVRASQESLPVSTGL